MRSALFVLLLPLHARASCSSSSGQAACGVAGTTHRVFLQFVLSGSVADYDSAALYSIKMTLSMGAQVHVDTVNTSSTPIVHAGGSVLVSGNIWFASKEAADVADKNLVEGIMASPAALQTALNNQFRAGGASLTTTVAEIYGVVVLDESGTNYFTVVMISILVGAVVVVLCVCTCVYRHRKDLARGIANHRAARARAARCRPHATAARGTAVGVADSKQQSQEQEQREQRERQQRDGRTRDMHTRVSDIPSDNSAMVPIKGVRGAASMPLMEAARACGLESVAADAFIASERGALLTRTDPHGLTADEAAALTLYTMVTPHADRIR